MLTLHAKTARTIAVRVAAAAMLVYAARWSVAEDTGATPASLLRNGGFEDGLGERPFLWTVSIVPAEGASAVWDDKVSRSGLRSVQLSTATRYPSEPYNNWNQSVVRPLAGKDVTVRGFVKGHNVEGAALWLQCFQRGSTISLATAASNETQPLQGSFGWTEQEVSLRVPQGTDFIVVRLTLIGTGTVWFDDIVMEVVEQDGHEPPKEGAPDEQESDSVEQTGALTAALEAVAEENRKLRATNEQLSEQIDQLSERVEALQMVLEQLQASEQPTTEPGLPFTVPPRNIPARRARSGSGTR